MAKPEKEQETRAQAMPEKEQETRAQATQAQTTRASQPHLKRSRK
jgi:hypothetical protein